LRPRLPFPFVVILLAATSIPGLVAQARDVDVLLYMAAAARANALHALPYTAAWIEKGPLAMAAFQLIGYSFPALALLWLACAIAGAWLAAALAREAGASWADGWAALAFAIGIGAVGGSLNTEVLALVPRRRRAPPLVPPRARVAAGAPDRRRVPLPAERGCATPDPDDARGRARRGLAQGHAPGRFVRSPRRGHDGPLRRGRGVERVLLLLLEVQHVDLPRGDARHARPHPRIPWDAFLNFLWPVRTTALLAWRGIALTLRRPNISLIAIAATAGGLLVAVIPGLRFFSHYAALALPMLAALAALGLEAIVARAGARTGPRAGARRVLVGARAGARAAGSTPAHASCRGRSAADGSTLSTRSSGPAPTSA
jgi:hypothetical protein